MVQRKAASQTMGWKGLLFQGKNNKRKGSQTAELLVHDGGRRAEDVASKGGSKEEAEVAMG